MTAPLGRSRRRHPGPGDAALEPRHGNRHERATTPPAPSESHRAGATGQESRRSFVVSCSSCSSSSVDSTDIRSAIERP